MQFEHLSFREDAEELLKELMPKLAGATATVILRPSERIIVPFSFRFIDRNIVWMTSVHQATSLIGQMNLPKLNGKFVFCANFVVDQKIFDSLERVYENSIYKINLDRDIMHQKMIDAMQNSYDALKYPEDFVKFLDKTFSYKFSLISIEKTLALRKISGAFDSVKYKLSTNILREAKYTNNPVQTRIASKNIIVHPLINQFGTKKPLANNFILLESDLPVEKLDIEQIQFYINDFYREKYIRQLSDKVSRWQGYIGDLARAYNSSTQKQFWSAVKTVVVRALGIIIEHTPAQSCTFRTFNCASNCLDVFAQKQQRGFGRDIRMSSRIRGTRSRSSVNAFTFKNDIFWKEGVYIPNVEVIPDKYRKLGLQGIAVHRSRTKTEWCLTVRMGNEAIGTINIESSFFDAFDGFAREYVLIVRKGIEEFISNIAKTSDFRWLVAQGFTQLNIHELEQALRSTDFFDEHQREFLSGLIVRDQALDKRKAYHKRALVREVGDYIDDVVDSLNAPSVKRVIEYNELVDDKKVSRSTMILLFSIITNLIDNTIAYGDITRDKIIIYYENEPTLSDDSVADQSPHQKLRIRYKTYGDFDPKTWSQLTLAPVRGMGGELHFGMYFLGLASRSLGGTVMLEKDEFDGGASIIEVRVQI